MGCLKKKESLLKAEDLQQYHSWENHILFQFLNESFPSQGKQQLNHVTVYMNFDSLLRAIYDLAFLEDPWLIDANSLIRESIDLSFYVKLFTSLKKR